MFEQLLKNRFQKNIDIVNATNKILIDGIPEKVAISHFLLNKENQKEVYLILNLISTTEKMDFQKLSFQKKKPYIVELNSIISKQMNNLVNRT
jgi:hypothetical protein